MRAPRRSACYGRQRRIDGQEKQEQQEGRGEARQEGVGHEAGEGREDRARVAREEEGVVYEEGESGHERGQRRGVDGDGPSARLVALAILDAPIAAGDASGDR